MPDKDAIQSIILELVKLQNEVNDLEDALRLIKLANKIETTPKPQLERGFKNFILN